MLEVGRLVRNVPEIPAFMAWRTWNVVAASSSLLR